MRFSKWHALGNVYLLAEPADGDTPLDARGVRQLCAGDADGVLEVVAAGAGEAEIVVWNADGSTAELSGNGTRIAAKWLSEQTGERRVRVRVGERTVPAFVHSNGDVEQDLGEIQIGPVEVVEGIEVTPVSVGNPHAVVRGDPDEIRRIGPLLETHRRFPGRTNVQVVRVDGPGDVTARVWERGVGETRSSGTSAAAAAAATHGAGDVTVHFPGGDLLVRLEHGRAWLTGPAERIDYTVASYRRGKLVA
jgi:diaminopimelate epimerase